MRQGVTELREFYASALGRAVRAMVSRKVTEAWGDAAGLDVLALGYATPFLDSLEAARRTVAAMPAGQGVESWPAGAANRAFLAEELALALPNALFDRILAVHALEESDDARGLLAETARVLAPSGRLILAVTARRGLWANAESNPFGQGRPFSRRQLEQLVREAELEPVSWTRALYAPPAQWAARWAEPLEQAGALLWPAFAGVIMMEAVKQTFAVRPVRAAVRTRRPALRPVGAAAGPGTATAARSSEDGENGSGSDPLGNAGRLAP